MLLRGPRKGPIEIHSYLKNRCFVPRGKKTFNFTLPPVKFMLAAGVRLFILNLTFHLFLFDRFISCGEVARRRQR